MRKQTSHGIAGGGRGVVVRHRARIRAQQNGVQHASDFTSVEYYEPTNQQPQQIKSIMSGAEALPQPGGLLIIKQLSSKCTTRTAGWNGW